MTTDKSFLVVDDSATMRQLIAMILRKMGYAKISDAANGKIALERLESDSPDIVLTDINMPEMDGLEFIEKARAKYPKLPIVILSSFGDDAIRDNGLQLGANGYLTKPLSRPMLAEVLETVFA
jgi:YesN/AraC family two-component response regulator